VVEYDPSRPNTFFLDLNRLEWNSGTAFSPCLLFFKACHVVHDFFSTTHSIIVSIPVVHPCTPAGRTLAHGLRPHGFHTIPLILSLFRSSPCAICLSFVLLYIVSQLWKFDIIQSNVAEATCRVAPNYIIVRVLHTHQLTTPSRKPLLASRNWKPSV